MEIKSCLSKGRTYVAVRTIEAGTCLLREPPLTAVLNASLSYQPASFVLSREEKVLFDAFPRGVEPMASLLAIRTFNLLRNNSAANIERDIQSLCDSHPARRADYERGVEACAQIVMKELARTSSLAIKVSLPQVIQMLNRISLNAFTLTDETMQPIGLALYAKAAVFNHSCCPNATQSFDLSSTGPILSIHANRNIHIGEEITISYIDVGFPSWWRRQELFTSYGFICHCAHCCLADPIPDAFRCRLCEGNVTLSSTFYDMHYRAWLKHELVFPLPCTSQASSDGNLPMPCAPIIASLKSSAYATLCLQCTRCKSTPSTSQILADLQLASRRHSQMATGTEGKDSTRRVKGLQQVYTRLTELLHSSHYAVVRVADEYNTALLLNNDFEEAYEVSRRMHAGMRVVYSAASPVLSLHLLVFGKLALYCGKQTRAHSLLTEALELLQRTQGATHPLTAQVKQLLRQPP